METFEERSSTFCGSTAYVPPEILENNPYRVHWGYIKRPQKLGDIVDNLYKDR